MTYVIPAYTPRVEAQEFARKNAWGSSLKNVLFGSLENWRDHALTVGAVYYVAQSIFFFIGGYWLYSVIGICTAALMAKMRKDLREFANLRKETGDYQKQNNSHRNLNLQQKEITKRLEKDIGDLEIHIDKAAEHAKELDKQCQQFQGSNKVYAFNNEVLKTSIESLRSTTKELDQHMKDASSSNKKVSKAALKAMNDTLKKLDQQQKIVKDANTELTSRQTKMIKRVEKLLGDVQKMDYRGVKAIRQADHELAKTVQAIENAKAELARIKDEISAATKINKEAAEYSKKAAKESYEAAKKSNAAASIFKMISNTFFASSEVNPTTGEAYTDWGKVIVYAGAIAAVSRWAIKG